MVLKQNLGSLTFLLAFIFFIFIAETPRWSSPPILLLLLKHSFTSPQALIKRERERERDQHVNPWNEKISCYQRWMCVWCFYQRFAVDLCKERSWAPPKWGVMSSLCFVGAEERRASVREEGASAASEGGMLKAFRDCWQPTCGKLKLGWKE